MLCWILVNRDGFSKRKLGSKDTGDDVFNTSLVYLAQFKVLKKLYLKLSVYNGTLTDDPLSVCAFLCTLLVKIFSKLHSITILSSCCTFSGLHSFHVLLFPMYTFPVLHSLHVALFSYCILFMLHFLRVALFSYGTLFVLHCHK